PTWRTVPLAQCNHLRHSHLHRSRFEPTATRQTSLNATVWISLIQDKSDYHHCLSESFLDHQAACGPPAKDASLLCRFPSRYDLFPSNILVSGGPLQIKSVAQRFRPVRST